MVIPARRINEAPFQLTRNRTMPLLRHIVSSVLVLIALTTCTPAAGRVADADGEWSALLSRHVSWNPAGTNTVVDHAGFQRDGEALTSYLDALASVDEAHFRKWSDAQRTAFLINAYNAYTIELVLTRYTQMKSIRDLGNLLRSPWKRRFAPLLGRQRTLDDIEDDLLRGAEDFDEPRIHFAVNCASVGCPTLRPEACTAERLDAQLDDQTRRFLTDRSRNRIEDDRLAVSSIFNWYAKDFESAGGVHMFLARHAGALGASPAQPQALGRGALRMHYLDYDWALNSPANIH